MKKIRSSYSRLALLGFVASTLMPLDAFAAKNVQSSMLKSNQSYRSNFSSQPNLDKGEVVLPVQASIIYIIEQSLPDFLSQFASRNKLQLTISEQVQGKLKKLSLPMQMELTLSQLAKSYGIEWHMQDKNLYVSNSLENVNRLIELGNMNLSTLKQAIKKAGLNPGANKMSYLKGKNAITLIGSASYIAHVEALIKNNQK